MPNEQSLMDSLKAIENMQMDKAYEGTSGKTVAIVRAFARIVSSLNPDGFLPPIKDNRFNYSTPAIRGQQNTTMQMWVDYARMSTRVLATALENVSSYPNNEQVRQAHEQEFSRHAQSFVDAWEFWLSGLQAVSGKDASTEARKVLDELKEVLEKAKQDGEATKLILKDSQEASKQIGAAEHAQAFASLADGYKWKAIGWLFATVFVALFFIAFVIYSGIRTFEIPKNEYSQLVQIIVGKVLALGVIYYMLVLTARSYRANSHLAAVNRHRATALQIFKTFADATSDDQTKNAILLETTRSIYAHTSTGFLAGEDPSSPIQVVEILKALTPNKGA